MITVGPSEYSRGGQIRFGYYGADPGDQRPRLAIYVESAHEREYVATVNLDHEPRAGAVYLKDWGGNQGVPEALERAGVVRLLNEFQRTGRMVAQLAELTPLALAELAVQKPGPT